MIKSMTKGFVVAVLNMPDHWAIHRAQQRINRAQIQGAKLIKAHQTRGVSGTAHIVRVSEPIYSSSEPIDIINSAKTRISEAQRNIDLRRKNFGLQTRALCA